MTYRSIVVLSKEGKWFVARSAELGVVKQVPDHLRTRLLLQRQLEARDRLHLLAAWHGAVAPRMRLRHAGRMIGKVRAAGINSRLDETPSGIMMWSETEHYQLLVRSGPGGNASWKSAGP